MRQRLSEHSENIEECKNIFVPWKWLVGILVPLIGIGGGGELLSSRAQAKQETRHETKYRGIDERFKNIEMQLGAAAAANYKADTILMILKSGKRK